MNHRPSSSRHPLDLHPSGELPSPASRARREAMLAPLTAALHRRRQHRRGVHALATLLLLAAVPTVLIVQWRSAASSPSPNVPFARHTANVAPAALRIQTLRTDSAVLARHAAPVASKRIVVVDDAGLQSALAQAGLPTGLIRVNGRTILARDLVQATGTNDLKLNRGPEAAPQALALRS